MSDAGIEKAVGAALALVAADLAALTDQGKVEYLNMMQRGLADLSPLSEMPVSAVQWIDVNQVEANDYNPNAVARNEMKLLHTSISHDGYTQPVVAIRDAERGRFVIVDGFHRFLTCKLNRDIQERTLGRIPVVVLEKDMNDRMASTVRHNRARGKHSIKGMGSMVFSMLDNGWEEAAICAELGISAEELLRLKHVTGFSKLFENAEYTMAWETRRQIHIRKEHKDAEKARAVDAG